jgi:transmembrane 9 superfamily protein 2/4
MSTCLSSLHVDYVSGKEHQKVAVGPLIFTYGVEWRESEVHWASRWDIYLSMNNSIPDAVHWFPIISSLLIVLFLTFMVAMILYRNLARDITKYNRVPTDEEKAEEAEEKGWKLVHADVFRAPVHFPMLFSVFIGTGTQMCFAVLIFIIFASIGFLSPANRGSIMIGALLLFVLLGCVAGYVSSKLYKSFKGKKWQMCTILTATLYPGIVFALFFVLNILVWSYGSTGAVPFGSFIALLALWFGISLPLVSSLWILI